MKNNKSGQKAANIRSITAMLLAALVASTTIIPAFSSGGDIRLINDLGEYGGEMSLEAQAERDWNEDLISVAKGAWLDAHAGEDRERKNGTGAATASALVKTEDKAETDREGKKATGSSLNPADVSDPMDSYDIFQDYDEGAAAGAVLKYLKKAKRKEKKASGEFLKNMLKEAVIPEAGVPRETDLKKEILALDAMNDDDYDIFRLPADYQPAAGDILFVAGHISTGDDTPASDSDVKKDDGKVVPMAKPAAVPVVVESATPSHLSHIVETEVALLGSVIEDAENGNISQEDASADHAAAGESAVMDNASAGDAVAVDGVSMSAETEETEAETLENLEELTKKERAKALKRNAKHAVLAGIIIATPEDNANDKITFLYSSEKDKVEIGVISKNETRIIGYADMEQLHDKYCGILEEKEEELEDEALAEELEEAVPNEKTVYTWKDDALTVTAKLTDPEAIPDDAELVVTPITKKTRGYNYQAYMDALTGEIASAGEDNTVLYDVAFLVDEKDENGEKTGRTIELQPENDKVSVSFRYSSAALTDEIGARDADKVKVVHLPLAEAAKENTDTTKDATAIAAADITPECLDASIAVGTKSGRIEFQTEGFSVFAITYTVDFHWEVNGKTYEFSLPGGGFVSLAHLVEALGISKSSAETEEEKKETAAEEQAEYLRLFAEKMERF